MFALKLFVVVLLVSVVSSGLLGGYSEKDSNDYSDCLEIAKKAIAKKNEEKNGKSDIKSIDRCATQVVAGINYNIHANVCDKEGSAFKRCAKCSMKVFSGLKREIEIPEYTCLPVFATDKY